MANNKVDYRRLNNSSDGRDGWRVAWRRCMVFVELVVHLLIHPIPIPVVAILSHAPPRLGSTDTGRALEGALEQTLEPAAGQRRRRGSGRRRRRRTAEYLTGLRINV